MVGVEVTLLGLQAVAAQRSSGVVVNLVTVVHLRSIEHLHACDGMCVINALYGTLLVLRGFAPWNLL